MQKFILPGWIIFSIAYMSYFPYPCFHLWKPRLIPYVASCELYMYFITLQHLPSRRFLNHFKILFFREKAQLLKCLLSKCKKLNSDPLNQCKESRVWQCVPAPPVLGEVEMGRFLELTGPPEKPRVWTLGFVSGLGSKTKGREQLWKTEQCRPWTSTYVNVHMHTQMQPITELVSRISKCRLTFKFKYTEKAP